MATHRVRLFVLSHGHGTMEPAKEGPSFPVSCDGGDDEIRAAIKRDLTARGYTLRSVSALAGTKPGEPAYAATVVAPKDEGHPVPAARGDA